MIEFSISSKVLLTKGDVLGISLKSRFMVETIFVYPSFGTIKEG